MSNQETPERIRRIIAAIDGTDDGDALSDMSWAIALVNRAREALVDGRKLDADANMSVAITALTRARMRNDKT